jgi:hypothetical protein
VRLAGTISVEGLDVRDASNAPLLSFKHAAIPLTSVEPLRQVVILGNLGVDGLSARLVRDAGGRTNLTPIAAAFLPSKNAPAAAGQSSPFYLFFSSFDLSNSELNLRDNTAASPVALALKGVHLGLKNFATDKKAAAVPFLFQAGVGQGSLSLKGTFDLAHSHAATQAALDKIDLPMFQPFLQPMWAGTIATGTLSAQVQVRTDLAAARFNVHVQPATVALDGLEVRASDPSQKPLQLAHLNLALDQVDLAARQAVIKQVRIDGLRLFVRRGRDGTISLTSFLRPSPSQQRTVAPAAAPPTSNLPAVQGKPARIDLQRQPVTIIAAPSTRTATSTPAWQYRIESLALDNAEAQVADDSAAAPVVLEAAPLKLHLKDLSSDLSKPVGVELDAALKPNGGVKLDGTAVVNPLSAKLHVVTTKIDLTAVDIYLGQRLNAKITRAAWMNDGEVDLSRSRDDFSMRYQGDAALINVHMHDKVTGAKFLGWRLLRATRINAEMGGGQQRVEVGELALSEFYARLILNSNGRLNLLDIIGGPKAAPTSLTTARVDQDEAAMKRTGTQPGAPQRPAARDRNASPSQSAISAGLKLGSITLHEGHINFTDNFIKPNYTADLTDITGKIGSFGTRSTRPAEVALQGEINSSAPIDITGSIDPLAPKAFVDIKAKADGVELTNLSPYSTKYTGYP